MMITKHSLQRKCPALVQYADDFVVFHEDREVIGNCQETSIDWLADECIKGKLLGVALQI
jgi:hypothetical protein